MVISGFQKTSLLDFPGKIAAVVFTPGCNFRCPFCYNRDLVLNSKGLKAIPEVDIFSYLEKRKGLLDGLVVTGGEPLLQRELSRFLKKVKKMGFLVKLDTNGSRPAVLRNVLRKGLVDFVAVDVKAPFDKRYSLAAGVGQQIHPEQVLESIKALIKAGINFELRTTVVPSLHKRKDLVDLAIQIADLDHQSSADLKWYLQQFRPQNCLDPSFSTVTPYSRAELEEILVAVRKHIRGAELRGV